MIKLIKGYPYDNNYDYIKLYKTKEEQNNFFNSFSTITVDEGEEEGYIREGKTFIVDFNYDYLVSEGVNYVIWNNGYKDLYCFIISKEYVDEELTRLQYEVDVINTYLFDLKLKNSFVERKTCSLDEITDYDENIEMGEHIIESETVVLNKTSKLFAMFNGFKDFYVNEKGDNFKELNIYDGKKPSTVIDGVIYPMSLLALDDENTIEVFNNYLLDHPSLIGIISFPNCNYTKYDYFIPILKMEGNTIIKSGIGTQNMVSSVNSFPMEGEGVVVPKNTITDFYPYTYYVLTDNECEPLIMKPQYCSDYITITAKFALGHQPIERYYPNYYKGSTDGNIYNITNNSVMMLPTGRNAAIENLLSNVSQIEQNKKSVYANLLVGAVSTGIGIASGGAGLAVGVASGLTMGVNAINTVKENIARNKDIELTPTSIKSYGTPSARRKFGTNKVKIIKYTIKDIYKNKINGFINRYGNKYNNYATIDLNTYKGYLKMVAPDIDTKIDNQHIQKIITILERGIYIE